MYLKSIKVRMIIWGILVGLLFTISTYYITAFCAIYTKTKSDWLKGGFISIIIHVVVIQPLYYILKTIFRELFRKNTNVLAKIREFDQKVY